MLQYVLLPVDVQAEGAIHLRGFCVGLTTLKKVKKIKPKNVVFYLFIFYSCLENDIYSDKNDQKVSVSRQNPGQMDEPTLGIKKKHLEI